jgi:hypothetical protein
VYLRLCSNANGQIAPASPVVRTTPGDAGAPVLMELSDSLASWLDGCAPLTADRRCDPRIDMVRAPRPENIST